MTPAHWFIHGRGGGGGAPARRGGGGGLLPDGPGDGEAGAWADGVPSPGAGDDGDGVEAACTVVMDELQDGVMDRLGRPWPELVDADGGFVGVLEPRLVTGIACWVLRGVPFCAVGQLSAAIPAAGLGLR